VLYASAELDRYTVKVAPQAQTRLVYLTRATRSDCGKIPAGLEIV